MVWPHFHRDRAATRRALHIDTEYRRRFQYMASESNNHMVVEEALP